GSPVPMFVAGARLLSNNAIGPLAGVAFNLTLLSYEGRLDMGLNTDRAAVTEPAMLRRFIADATDDLIAFAG
ncbi:WS/DGAT domain-containing protein, partial [Ilumatobacter sp.]|uniref:WS/DGAT domain-containing protein n=1 Tax=Ilumatobacter sp. TaxID=1967498 RepID=UPI003C53C819